jgi:hypothetical protein
MDAKKQSARKREHFCGRIGRKPLLPFALGGDGGLGGLGLGHALLELIDATGGIDELLLAGVEGVARVADTHQNGGAGRAGFNDVPAGTPDFCVLVLRMNISFHTAM